MASTLTKVLVHITFSTKDRTPSIPESIEEELYAYIGGVCRGTDSVLLAKGGTADHVHLLVSLSKSIALSDLLLGIKRDSSHWIKRRDPSASRFAWQDGYFAFSIGESAVGPLTEYLAKQKQHHERVDFKDEMRTLFQRYGIEYDERYVWG